MSADLTAQSVLNDLDSARPQLRTHLDAIAISANSVLRRLGFKCVAAGDQKIDAADASVAPAGWDQSHDSVSFTYTHSRTSNTYVVKFLELGPKVLVHGIVLPEGIVHSLELNPKDYINDDVPLSEPQRLLRNVDDLVARVRDSLANKLVPPLAKAAVPPAAAQQSPLLEQQYRPGIDSRPPEYDYDPLRVPPVARRPSPYG
eukprot:TRINITY_DN3206_c0_g1_i1.p1 TRINITY_DN3206_c0_g1~~TRINITY_DN3206_c0_g1_i1.p1  ORF type:complete len:202 (-),score=36.51 TRINITY_DN3206_c0_g1_i1:495-1100(-)